jgi:serine/threonine protein kinase
MGQKVAEHPGWEELQAFGQGRLAAEAARGLEEHLAGCVRCCELLEQAPGDAFLSRLREAGVDTTAEAVAGTVEAPAIPPELIGHPRYRVLGLVDQGGMGAVYRAEHRRMERLVALKVIHPSLMRHPSAVQRFQQEVRAAARLHHPNIVTAYDADQAGGLHFLVMEYVEGISLAALVHQRGPLPVAEACTYIRQAALGLQHAHEHGLVHRDIKPSNLMVVGGESPGPTHHAPLTSHQVKILDFGLARLPHTADGSRVGGASNGPLTGAGAVLGTADYIAPEQADDPRAADIRADIYALGCTLFHLLAGRPPFPEGTVAQKLDRHADTPLPRLETVRPEVPPGLEAVVARMTAKDPADRYATPAAVAEALAPFCAAEPPRPPRGRKRRRWLVAAGLALLAAGLLAGAIFFRLRTDRGEVVVKGDDNSLELTIRRFPEPVPEVSEEEALQAIQRLGGRIGRDEQVPDKPVRIVILGGTNVTDADLRVLAAFKQLRSLDLGRTQVTDEGLKHLTGLTGLTSLTLPQTQVTDAGMESVGQLKQLQGLDLGFTAVGDAGLKRLTGLTELHTLVLHRTRVTDAAMADVGRLKHLVFLSLGETAITDAGLEPLAELKELTNLILFTTPGVGDEGMKSAAQMERLISIDLRGTQVTDAGLRELAGCKGLVSLQVGCPKVTDDGVRALAKLTRLKVLDLSYSDVTDEGLREVARHRPLTNLNLHGARRVTDVGVKHLAGLKHLGFLVLSGTAVTDAGVKDVAGLPQLKHLALSNTGVTDASLRELARCPQLTFLTVREADNLTEAGLAELKRAQPNLRIQRK